MNAVCKGILSCVVLLMLSTAAYAEANNPPNEAARKMLETRGPLKNLGSPQVVNCTIRQGECNYTGSVGGWATQYFRGECDGGQTGQETMNCTPGKNVSCTKANPHSGYWECSCNNWSTKKSDAHVTVTCPKP